jgi:hypothetical protein
MGWRRDGDPFGLLWRGRRAKRPNSTLAVVGDAGKIETLTFDLK